jgi:hypothetical protein
MKRIVLLFVLASLSGCATRHAEYVDYYESPVVFSGPDYYWFEYRRPIVHLAPRAHYYHWNHWNGGRYHAPRHPPASRPVPHAAGRQGMRGGHAPRPDARPPRHNDRRASSTTFRQQPRGTGRTNAAPRSSGAGRVIPSGRRR